MIDLMPKLVLSALMIAAVVICTGGLVMTFINLGFYMNPRKGGRSSAPQHVGAAPLVSVCIPARNEEANLPHVVASLLRSTHPQIEVLVYDDQSSDRTPQILRELQSRDPRVRAAPTQPLPDGWVGKQWACHQLGLAAKGQWLLFTDADVRFGPGAVSSSLDAARALGADMVSTFPQEETGSLAEHLVVPMIHFLLFSYLPMGQMRGSTAPSASAGCGQFLFVRSDAYHAIGGHSSWKDSMHDGIRMPRTLRRAGYRTDLFDGSPHVSCRMYTGLAQTWRGFAKNAYEGLGSVPLLVFLTVLHLVGHVAPWAVLGAALVSDDARGAPLVLALAAVLLAISQRMILARHFRQHWVGVVLHPLAVLMMTAIQWHSFVLSKQRRRAWRGRTAPASG